MDTLGDAWHQFEFDLAGKTELSNKDLLDLLNKDSTVTRTGLSPSFKRLFSDSADFEVKIVNVIKLDLYLKKFDKPVHG